MIKLELIIIIVERREVEYRIIISVFKKSIIETAPVITLRDQVRVLK